MCCQHLTQILRPWPARKQYKRLWAPEPTFLAQEKCPEWMWLSPCLRSCPATFQFRLWPAYLLSREGKVTSRWCPQAAPGPPSHSDSHRWGSWGETLPTGLHDHAMELLSAGEVRTSSVGKEDDINIMMVQPLLQRFVQPPQRSHNHCSVFHRLVSSWPTWC